MFEEEIEHGPSVLKEEEESNRTFELEQEDKGYACTQGGG